MRVKIRDIVDAFDCQTDETTVYLNRRTGVIVAISEMEFFAAREKKSLDGYPEWQRENIEIAREILDDEDKGEVYVTLPMQFDIHEWEIMDRFARTLEDPQDREALVHALRGKGAFRRFRNAIRRLGVEEAWYDYLDQALRQIAVEWCEEEGIPFVDD